MKYSDLLLFRRVLEIARPYWNHIFMIFLLNLLSIPIQLLGPLPLKIAVDSILGPQPLPDFLQLILPANVKQSPTLMLAVVAIIFISIAFVARLQDLFAALLRTYTAEKIVLEFRAQLFRHVQRLSLSYHDSKGSSDSVYRIQSDAPAIQYLAIDGVIPFITASLTLVGMIYITVQIDWQLALVALMVSPLLFFISRASRRRLRNSWSELKSHQSSAMSVVQEVLAAVRVVKAFGREEYEENRFVQHSDKSMQGQIRLTLTEGSFNFLVGMIIATGTAAALVIGVRHVESGTLTLGDLLIVMVYLTQLYEPLKTIGRKVTSMQSHLASVERAFSLLDKAPDVIERPYAKPLCRALGEIAFRNVSFAYTVGHRAVRDISFEIEPGLHVGLVGKTGAGKTTLMSLLMRFYDLDAGQILLDGVDVRDYKLDNLRNQFAVVLQDPVLFSASIAENIAYAHPGASEAEIIEAAKAANAHDFILSLPEGYQTQVGERGMLLSGGERQRIALARAFLKDAPILIMDEPTSAIDTKTEAAIIEAMSRLMNGRTTFIITHRPSALMDCDSVITIADGQIASITPSTLKDTAMTESYAVAAPDRDFALGQMAKARSGQQRHHS